MTLKAALGIASVLSACVAVLLGVHRLWSGPGEGSQLRERIVRLEGPIGDANANEVIVQLLMLQQRSDDLPIRLVIDSPGGAVSPALAIIDTIEMLKAPVFTHCQRTAGGVALVILTCGHRGERSAHKDAVLLFAWPKGSRPDDIKQQAEADRFGDIFISKVVTATGVPEEEVRRYFQGALSITGGQAKRIGFIDKLR